MSRWTELLECVERAEPSPVIPARALARAAELAERPARRRARRATMVVAAALGAVVLVVMLVIAAHSRRDVAPAAPVRPDRTDSRFGYVRYRPGRQGGCPGLEHADAGHGDWHAPPADDPRPQPLHRLDSHLTRWTPRRADRWPQKREPYTTDLVVVSTRAGGAHRAPPGCPGAPRRSNAHLVARQLRACLLGNGSRGGWIVSLHLVARWCFAAAGADFYREVGLDDLPAFPWSPDGRTIAFNLGGPAKAGRRGDGTREQSMLVDVASGAVHPLPASLTGRFAAGVFPHWLVGPIFQPHGDLIAAYSIQPYLTTATSRA